MLKPNDVEVLTKEELTGIDKARDVINRLLHDKQGKAKLLISNVHDHVIKEIARRYGDNGWDVVLSVRGPSTIELRIVHPWHNTPPIHGKPVELPEYTFDFSQPDVPPVDISKSH